MFALLDGARVLATPGAEGARCPICGSAVLPKCGPIRTHHWAHVRAECDSWAEPESEWHLGWKSRFPLDQVEVSFGPHRADVATALRVIEFQNSAISPEDIHARETFYSGVRPRGMVWVLNGVNWDSQFSLTPKDGFISFKWRRCPARWLLATAPICVDFGDGLLLVKKMGAIKGGASGWGYGLRWQEFVTKFGE